MFFASVCVVFPVVCLNCVLSVLIITDSWTENFVLESLTRENHAPLQEVSERRHRLIMLVNGLLLKLLLVKIAHFLSLFSLSFSHSAAAHIALEPQ